MDEVTDSRAVRAGRNQALYREVNERVRKLNEAFDALPIGEWICECANDECFETIELTHEEYEAVRAGERRFFVKPDDAHLVPEAEVVVERHERYWVVEKIGVAGRAGGGSRPSFGGRVALDSTRSTLCYPPWRGSLCS